MLRSGKTFQWHRQTSKPFSFPFPPPSFWQLSNSSDNFCVVALKFDLIRGCCIHPILSLFQMVIKFCWRLISTWLDSRMRLVRISRARHTNFLLSNCHWPFSRLCQTSTQGNKTWKRCSPAFNNPCSEKKWERNDVGHELDNEPGTCQMQSLDIGSAPIQIPHITEGRAATLLDIRPVGFSLAISRIRSVRFHERSYWSLTTPVGSWSDVYFSFTAFFFFK